ncbi:hypothetical protein ACFLZ4_01825 [Patescibacteria group bacterium]
MNDAEIITLITLLLLCFVIAFFLYKKVVFFKKVVSIPLLVLGAILSSILHNLIYALFYEYFTKHGGDEAFFFILTFILLGTAIFLIPIQLINFLVKKYKK